MDIINQYFSEFREEQTNQFAQLQELYDYWNNQINVISRKDIENIYEKHVLHSLSIAAVFNFNDKAQILDIGTGGGFPGIPLAIFFPEVHFTLVDSVGKKIKVVNEIAKALNLKNIEAIHTRVEDIKGRSFDFVVSRAVTKLNTLWNWGKPLLRKGEFGCDDYRNGLICLKGGDLSEEIAESQLKPMAWNIHTLFPLEFYKEKFILYQQK